MTDLTHMSGRVAHGQGHFAEAGHRAGARAAQQRHLAAALVYVTALEDGDQGAAARHLASLRRDPGIDPWALVAAVARRALCAGAAPSQDGNRSPRRRCDS